MDGLVEGSNARLRALPSLQRLLETPQVRDLLARHTRGAIVSALRDGLSGARARALAGEVPPDAAQLLDEAAGRLHRAEAPILRPVINATGIALHTNLGRAPLATEAVAATLAASGYCTLEYDPDSGVRGHRLAGVEPLLRALSGAEAAVAVNNGAAAILLALAAHAGGGEVVVSRGELVEIGGGFRIPDVIRQCGGTLVEVGTTNRTRLADYADAITPATRVILKVHQSNYRVIGFTGEVPLADLAALAHRRGLLLVDDLGSGTIQDVAALGRSPERTVAASVSAGADLVTFSGDKLLGGPQAGIVAGTLAAIDPLRRHPLMRALRLDKLVLAALEATLRLHLDPGTAVARIPVLRMLAQGEAVLHARAEWLLALLSGLDARIEPSVAFPGGGALPMDEIASRAVSLDAPCGAEALARRLRRGDPAVVGRVSGARVWLDMLAVADADLPVLAESIRAGVNEAVGGAGP